MASTSKTASDSSSSNKILVECTPASQPASSPAHNCREPATSLISSPIIDMMALLTIRRVTSPIPMGLTPGCLSIAISLQATKVVKASGST